MRFGALLVLARAVSLSRTLLIPGSVGFIALVHSGMARPFTLEVKLRLRDTLKNGIINEGGRWPLTNSELVNKHVCLFQKFVNSINFEEL